MVIKQRRVSGVRNGFNPFASAFDVKMISAAGRMFVIIGEAADGNPGPTITNCAEYACPQIAAKLGLDWETCVFIETYPPTPHLREFDSSYDEICFAGPVTMRPAFGLGTTIQYAPLARPGWRPLVPQYVVALLDAGFVLSRVIGRRGEFERTAEGVVIADILSYNGGSYETTHGRFPCSALRRIDGVLSLREQEQLLRVKKHAR